MTIPRPLRLLALGAVAVATLAPYAADSGTCANAAARDLLTASYADALLNSPKGEDTDFFIRSGGIPNIMVLLDATGSMNRLPPDGPNYFGGTLPPGYYVGNNKNDGGTQTAAFAANDTTAAPNTRIVGCGLDPVSAGNAAFVNSAMYKTVMARRFFPPCGQAVDNTLVGAAFKGQAIDYAAQMTVCPYFTSSNNVATGAPGFDPDYYDGGDPMATSAGSKKIFFGKDLIFHDNPNMDAGLTRDSSLAFGHDFDGGFYYDGLAPHLDKATGDKSTVASFCAQQGTAAPQVQGSMTHSAICQQCLNTRGWYYDGVIINDGENNADLPSLWYTGNYLSFFPPKFLIARKVMKDIIAVQSRVRMALATFAGSGATFIQPFNPSCGMPDNSSFDSNRASYVSGVDGIDFSGGTPMSVALFDAGRYYHSPDLPWFGNAWEDGKMESADNSNQFAICYACQSSSVIVITDGQPSYSDGDSLPSSGLLPADLVSNKKAGDTTTGIRGISSAVCPECDAFSDTDDSEDYKDNLAKVAFYLHNMDLRKDAEATLDCKTNSGAQLLDTYTIGFATKAIPGVNTILSNAAKAGGGIFVPAENTVALKEGFNAIIEEINGRSTSFSVATISTLQTTSGRAVIVPRFQPGKTAHWMGHVSRYDLYSEFVEGCTPNGTDDYDCDGICDGVFLVDRAGDFISEDANGAFVKNDPPNKPVCAQAPRCGTNCAVPGSAPAMPFWDAAYAWGDNANQAKREWKNRNVWTTVDTAAPIGVIDGQDKMVKLSTADDQAATDILPYLALGGGNTCNVISGRFSSAGDYASAALVSGSQVECAKSILRYILGADLFNERGLKTGYPPATQDEAVDRDYILGDVFHSSPVVVQPPLPRKGVVCKLGLENQCIIALWDTDTEGGPTGYDAYSLNARYINRRKVVLVGANDGMLHAFNGGEYVVDSTHPLGGYYETGRMGGEAKWGASATFSPALELWAFIPPDLLSKLPLFLGSEHQLFVDGAPMVRDVWVDGSDNGALSAGQVDDVKEGGEFHTMAVVGERRGGTRFFALDITDATEPGSVPRFRWIYPQPSAAESLTAGESYDDFLPQPPPIGPVRIAADGSPGNGTHPATPKYGNDGSDLPFHERWVAFLSGGFDLQYARGRGVHMVDVWTGAEVFDFSYPDAASPAAAGDPRFNLRFPIPAVVGMIRWGPTENAPDRYESRDNYFDTATFGDAGGQVWTLRFHVPGRLGSDGRVTNWFGARAFQMGGQTGCKLCGAQPFFYMTANGATPGQRHLRTYLGTGDRFNLMDKYGGTCGPNNLRACIFRGCTVTVTAADNVLSNPGAGFAQRGWSEVACAAIANTGLDGPATGCTVEGKVKVAISGCPSPEVNNGPTATAKQAAMSCLELADGYSCTRSLAVQGPPLSLSQTSNAPTVGNWFFSLRMFQDGDPANANTRPVFKTLAEAKVYDDHRLYVTQNNATRTASPGITLIDSASNAPAAVANEESQGWAMYYNHSPTVTVDEVTVEVDWRDERTSSGTTLASGVLLWNTLQPPISMATASTTGGCRLSKCTQEDRRLSYLYGADPVTGGILQQLTDDAGAKTRAKTTLRPVPPPPPKDPWFINEKGQVKKKPIGVSPGAGVEGITGSEAEDPVTEAGILLIDKELYMCRHAETPVCK